MRRLRVVALAPLVALAACGEPSSTPDGGADAAVDGDLACPRPALDAPWLRGLLTDAVAQLAAAPRFTSTQRTAARSYLASQLTAFGWTPMQHTYPSGINVHVTIPATAGNGGEIIVGAHFDTVSGSPGANDNASGTAVVLAIARFLADMPCRSAPVTIVLFDEEELGLFGSRAFAQTRQVADVQAVHTIDQVSWDGDGDRRFELEVPTPELEAAYRAAAQVTGALVTVTPTEGTDHEPFRDRGFAAVGVTEEYVGGDTSPHRHQPTDTAATVDTEYLVLAAQLTAQVILTSVEP